MIKLLYLTGMFPFDQNLASGIFVIKRIENIISIYSDYISLDSVALVSLYSRILSKINNKLPEITIKKARYNFIDYLSYRLDVIDYFYKIFFKGISYLRVSHNFYVLLKEKYNLNSYDIIHSHFVQLGGFVANEIYRNFHIPYIVTVHGSDMHVNPYKDTITKIYTLKVLEEASKVIFVSNYLLNNAKKIGYSGRNAVIIPNGVDINIFKPLDKDYCRFKLNKYGKYRENNYIIGYVGNLNVIKGAHYLPKIFKNINDKIKNVQFLIVGDGELRDYLIKKGKEYKLEIIFAGRVSQEELKFLYNAMDVLIVPSLKEGFSCVILEAQACGVPAVGSNVGGIPEAIGGSEYGRVVELDTNFEEKFAENVVEILYNKPVALKLIERAKNLSWENIVGREIEVYKEVYKNVIYK